MMKIAWKDSVCSWPSPQTVPGSPPPSSTSPPMPGQLIHTASAYLTRNSSSTTAKHPANTTLNLVSHMKPETQINIETQKYIQNARETCSGPETYCEYANTSVSGTEALPFSTQLTPSFSLFCLSTISPSTNLYPSVYFFLTSHLKKYGITS